MNNIATNIKSLRAARGLTQDALAQQLHVTRQAVSNWETGKSQPDIETIMKLAQALHVTAEELIYGKKENPNRPKQAGLLPADNVGARIKSLANVIQIVGFIVSIILGCFFGVLALVVIPIGCLLTYVLALLIYGVGHAAENSEKCAAYLLAQDTVPEETLVSDNAERLDVWTCFSCGTKNRGHVSCCQNCSVTKIWSEMQSRTAESE